MILIVDDKRENILSLQSALALHGYAIDSAQSGEEALKKVLKNNYALIILDVQMPGMDGFEVAELISGSSKFNDVPIIFLSAANTEKKFITKGFRAGAVDYITKPVDLDIFLLKVNTLYKLYEQKRALNEMQEELLLEIEERKKAQSDSQLKAQQLVSVLESLPQLAFTLLGDGTLAYTNSLWREYARTESGLPETHPDDPDVQTILKEMIQRQDVVETELRIRRHDSNTFRYFLLRTSPVREMDRVVLWVGTFTDIDEQKMVSKKKDEFISVASHELKTPLTSLKAYIQLLERVTKNDPQLSPYITKSLSQIQKLDRLIVDLLDVSQIESGSLRLHLGNFDIDRMVTNAVELIRQTFPDYEFIRQGNLSVMVHGDEGRLEQVVLNFLSNAVKYSPGNKKVLVDIRMVDDREVKISIQDFGIGISKDEQEKVFDKFYRSMESSRNFQGLGLGLYICADILRRHKAHYGVESEIGKGTTFYFSLPVIKSN
jgi:signal transduction histidine kinase